MTGRTRVPLCRTGRGTKNSTGSMGSRWETTALRTFRVSEGVVLTGDWLESSTCQTGIALSQTRHVPLARPRPRRKVWGESGDLAPNGIPLGYERWGSLGSLDRGSHQSGRRIPRSGREIRKGKCRTGQVDGKCPKRGWLERIDAFRA